MEVYVISTNVIWFLSYVITSFMSFPIHSVHTELSLG